MAVHPQSVASIKRMRNYTWQTSLALCFAGSGCDRISNRDLNTQNAGKRILLGQQTCTVNRPRKF